ncbi:NADH-quinone oxidoreductase subunit C [Neobacillus terrae]|uniref:NADH-quinone oxidoreductase subunit C n=1 Tax=Neobacillus terrae TaxID=3034837 RepID=UPI00140C9047|nr:NADH-quinone oxidoreductase subunit C [Neobacillus terrae]NHM30080.1 NADH-quinone oxidoreductase subunit C [Neobacillus terrae]
MSEKDLDQLKKEAAEKAKAAALAKRQAKLTGESAPQQDSKPADKPEVKAPANDDDDLAKRKAAAAAKAKAAALAKRAREQGEAAPPVEAPAADAGDDDLAKKKAAAAAKAKAAALAKKAREQGEEAPPVEAGGDDDLAKRKAAAAAKAKAAALAKMKAQEAGGSAAADGDDAKAKAVAAAKAKAAAAAKAKAAALAKQGGSDAPAGGDDEKAKAIAAAKAKAAAAAKAKAAAAGKAGAEEAPAAPAAPAAPSPNQPYLDKYVKVIEENLGPDVLEDYYINKLSKDVPTLVVKRDTYFKLAQFLKYNERLGFDYLSELHGTDFETHMEVYVHLFSYKNRQSVALKVKIDREKPSIDSLQPVWAGANWPECEAYDLLGIQFTGHPNLHRILLGEDWVGHPLRKDYEQYDVEV